MNRNRVMSRDEYLVEKARDEWRAKVGLVGQFLNWLTLGWHARVVLKQPFPKEPGR